MFTIGQKRGPLDKGPTLLSKDTKGLSHIDNIDLTIAVNLGGALLNDNNEAKNEVDEKKVELNLTRPLVSRIVANLLFYPR